MNRKVHDTPTLSVLLSTYNGERFLQKQLQSLLTQSEHPDELVISDDGSSDTTVEIINTFASSAPFPVVIKRNTDRKGYRRNFVEAMSLCKSDLIAFCDQDDIWRSDKIAAIKPLFVDENVFLVHHNARLIDEQGKVIGKLIGEKKTSRMRLLDLPPFSHALGFTEVFRNSLSAFEKMHRRSLDHSNAGEPLAHDQWVFVLALGLGDIIYLNEDLADYRQHGGNLYGYTSGGHIDIASLKKLVKSKIQNQLIPIPRLSAAASNRAEMFAEIHQEICGDNRVRAATICCNAYLKYLELVLKRERVYYGITITERFEQWLALVKDRCYSGGDWGIARKASLRDFFSGVILGSIISRRAERLGSK